MIIELDGLAAGLEPQTARIQDICRHNNAREVRIAADDAERLALWKSRKRAFGAIGRLAPNYATQVYTRFQNFLAGLDDSLGFARVALVIH